MDLSLTSAVFSWCPFPLARGLRGFGGIFCELWLIFNLSQTEGVSPKILDEKEQVQQINSAIRNKKRFHGERLFFLGLWCAIFTIFKFFQYRFRHGLWQDDSRTFKRGECLKVLPFWVNFLLTMLIGKVRCKLMGVLTFYLSFLWRSQIFPAICFVSWPLD